MNIRQTLIWLILLLSSFWGVAQVTTSPAFIQKDYTGEIIVYFDATRGNRGMTGATSCYAHTGVITNESTGNSDWKHAPEWKDNSPKYKMESVGENQWKLTIPNLKTYYELNENEVVEKLAFVFRDATASKEGKSEANGDIFVDLHESGLQVAFTNPAGNYALAAGSSLDISFSASAPAHLRLSINDTEAKQLPSATTLTYKHTFAVAGDYILKATATLNGQTVSATTTVCVVEGAENEPRPAGLTDGINYSDDPGRATLVLHAPGKLSVFIVGDFSDWTQQNKYQMKRDGDYWWLTLTDLEPGKEYGFQYLVNSVSGAPIRIADPYTEKILHELDTYIPTSTYPNIKPYPTGKTNGPVAVIQTQQPAYHWQINDFKVKNQASLSIYELLIRDFTATGDLNGVTDKLDYLQRMGITAIELMPCQEFSGNDSWGYNPIFYFAMDKAYGTKEMYKRFIDECHRRGIAVLLDVVYNQADQDMPFVKLYFDGTKPTADNPWFNVSAPHPYSVFYDFNHESEYTRAFVKRNLKFLLEEYKFDGFRFDLTKGFTNKPSTESTASMYDQSRIDILKDYNRAIRAVKPDAVVILEHFCSSSEEKVLAQEGMLLWRNMNGAFGNILKGTEADVSGIYADGKTMPFNSLVGFSESHDEERTMYKSQSEGIPNMKLSLTKRIARAKLAALYSMLVPGPKMIWQFEEMGYDISIETNGRTGRKPLHWEYLDDERRKGLYDLYATLFILRRDYPALFDGSATLKWTPSNLIAGSRLEINHPDLTLIVIANFAQTSGSIYPAFPTTGIWHELMTGEQLPITGLNQNSPITLPANEFKLFANKKPDIDLAITEISDQRPFSIYPNPTSGLITFRAGIMEEVQIVSAQGVILKSEYTVSSIDISQLATGNYWIVIRNNGIRQSIPVLKR
ncbi:MAG: alpha-amylase family glycosyl hydrolase [Bacteroidales bacterium]